MRSVNSGRGQGSLQEGLQARSALLIGSEQRFPLGRRRSCWSCSSVRKTAATRRRVRGSVPELDTCAEHVIIIVGSRLVPSEPPVSLAGDTGPLSSAETAEFVLTVKLRQIDVSPPREPSWLPCSDQQVVLLFGFNEINQKEPKRLALMILSGSCYTF